MPLVMPESDTEKRLECYVCQERFCNNQGFSVHLKCRDVILPKPSNVTECIDKENQRKTIESTCSSTKSNDYIQSLKSADTIQPTGSTSSEPTILGTYFDRSIEVKVEIAEDINIAPLKQIFLSQILLN